MIKHYKTSLCFLILTLCLGSTAMAQIPNASFENWTCNSNYCDPDGWQDINSYVPSFLGVFTCQRGTGGHTGTYCAKLVSKSVFGQVAPGICATGYINQNTNQTEGGFPLAYRAAKLRGWYKYAPQGGDNFTISINVYSGNTYTTTPMGMGSFTSTVAKSAWTQFSFDITYTTNAAADSAQITLLASDGANGVDGTILQVDDLELIDCSQLATNPVATNATCTAANGTLAVNPVGGASPYSYAWSNNAGNVGNITAAAGNYTVSVTDGNGCSVVATATIGTNVTTFNILTASTPSSCSSSTGTVTTTVQGGNSPFTYHWSNGPATTPGLTNVGAGNYLVTVTDVNGCTAGASQSVPTATGPTAIEQITNAKCNGSADGSVQVQPIGGTGTITYNWSVPNQTASSLNNVGAGNYTVTLTDANNCSFVVNATVHEPTAISNTFTVVNTTCFGSSNGAITPSVSGGTAPYAYHWNGSIGADSLINVAAGTYNLAVTDSNNCTFTASTIITQPTALTLALSGTNASCFGDSSAHITGNPAGGTAPYNYTWGGGSNYQTLTHVPAGIYTLNVVDSNGCTVQATDTVTQPTNVVATLAATSTTTSTSTDGQITASVTGGATPYSYAWSNSTDVNPAINLGPGSYCLTVTDFNGCSSTATCSDVVAGTGTGITVIAGAAVNLYPNPANNELVIETGLTDAKYEFSVYSLDGKLIQLTAITGSKATVNVKQLAVGLYSYQLKNTVTGQSGYGKVNIQR